MRIAAAAGLLPVLCGCTPAPSPSVSTPVGPRSGDATTPPTQTGPAARSQSAPTVTPAPNVPAATPSGPAAFASLRGLVRQITGAPAQNIAVELRPEIPTDASGPPRASTRTGQDGRYALERIANGRYLLSAGGGGAGSPQANVTVAGLDQTLDLEIESVARALVWLQLTGRVVDANDRGVPGARVWEAGGECHATTAADGTYRLVVIGDPGGPRRILDATTSDRSGFVLATEGSPQPPIRLTRPALSGVPSGVCPTGQRASQGRDVA